MDDIESSIGSWSFDPDPIECSSELSSNNFEVKERLNFGLFYIASILTREDLENFNIMSLSNSL